MRKIMVRDGDWRLIQYRSPDSKRTGHIGAAERRRVKSLRARRRQRKAAAKAGRGRVLLETVPDIEKEDSTPAEHPAHLPEYGSLVRHEHHPERADHSPELARAEWQAGGVRFAPVDALAMDQLLPCVIQHGPADVAGDQPARRIDALPQSPGHEPGPAGDLEHVIRKESG
jgi:hypothetical protein